MAVSIEPLSDAEIATDAQLEILKNLIDATLNPEQPVRIEVDGAGYQWSKERNTLNHYCNPFFLSQLLARIAGLQEQARDLRDDESLLRTRIAELQAERDQSALRVAEMIEVRVRQDTELEQLRAELSAAKDDVNRMNWLEDQGLYVDDTKVAAEFRTGCNFGSGDDPLPTLREMIDATRELRRAAWD